MMKLIGLTVFSALLVLGLIFVGIYGPGWAQVVLGMLWVVWGAPRLERFL